MTYSMDIDPGKRAPNPILGILLILSLVMFGGAIAWMSSGQVMPLLQLPLVLLSLILSVVVGFVYFLNPARGLTYLLLGILYFAFEFTARGHGDDVGGGSQTVIKGVLALMFAVLGVFTSSRWVFKSNGGFLLVFYATWALATSAYSPTPILGFASGIALLGVSMVAARIGMGTSKDVLDFWSAIYWASVLTCVLSFITLAIAPMQARDLSDGSVFRFRGVTGAANTLGPIMSIGAIVAMLKFKLTNDKRVRLGHAVMFLAFVTALFMSNSRSSIVGFIVGMAGAMVVMGSVGLMGFLVMIFIGLLLGSALLYPGLTDSLMSFLASTFARSGQVSELTTLTGRGVIWQACWKLIMDQPIFGYGLTSVRTVLPLAYGDEWGNTFSTAHNMLLESLISVGVAGTLPLLALIGVSLYQLTTYATRVRKGMLSASTSLPLSPLEPALSACATRCLLMLLIQGISEKAFAGQPGSSTLALGAIVATSVMLHRSSLVSRRPG